MIHYITRNIQLQVFYTLEKKDRIKIIKQISDLLNKQQNKSGVILVYHSPLFHRIF
jgi:hypothetical protein